MNHFLVDMDHTLRFSLDDNLGTLSFNDHRLLDLKYGNTLLLIMV
jgi:hypothetical protein